MTQPNAPTTPLPQDTATHNAKAPPTETSSPTTWNFENIVRQLGDRECTLVRRANDLPGAPPLPSTLIVQEITEKLRAVIFPGYFGSAELRPDTIHYYLGHTLDEIERTLEIQIQRGLAFADDSDNSDKARDSKAWNQRAHEITTSFLRKLPEIQRVIATDVQAAYEGDPALTRPGDAIFCYPGIFAVTNYRLAHELHVLGVPLLPRIMTEHAHSVAGIDIHPGATIGKSFFMDHGTGIVVGETCIIGDRVRVYQGVTLGAKSFPLDENGQPIKGIARHPIIEDDVCIYSGATILGRVTIGRGATIGGNVWLTRGVAPESRITIHAPRRERYEEGSGI